jgi:hypothetical protein
VEVWRCGDVEVWRCGGVEHRRSTQCPERIRTHDVGGAGRQRKTLRMRTIGTKMKTVAVFQIVGTSVVVARYNHPPSGRSVSASAANSASSPI